MSSGGNKSYQTNSTTNNQMKEVTDPITDLAKTPQQNTTRSASKRSKQGDDSFEQEHRMVNARNQYFNSTFPRTNQQHQQQNVTTSSSEHNHLSVTTSRSTFPPFRINFIGNSWPSELSIIKDMNKHFRIGLSYGRYSSNGNKKCFLIYANTSEQFDRLMDKISWPIQICSSDYEISFPVKAPMAYSIVATGVPAQWDIGLFESDIKKQYPTIIKVERLYVKGGIPISKVRIDFSTSQEVKKIIQSKRLLLDDENTSFIVQPYSPPTKILRCFNCQVYNDHIAVNCPYKDKPKCFRCGSNHPYNPNCQNDICCANCGQGHMAGNPNCPIKVEERRKQQQLSKNMISDKNINYNNNNKLFLQEKSRGTQNVWLNNAAKEALQTPTYITIQNEKATERPDLLDEMNMKLNQIVNSLDKLAQDQAKSNSNISNAYHLIKSCQNDINLLNNFLMKDVCPFLINLSNAVMNLGKKDQTEKLHPNIKKFKQRYEETMKTIEKKSEDKNQIDDPILYRSSSNESNSSSI